MEEDGGKVPDTVKLSKAKHYKSEGNDAYKNKNYRLAIGKYHRALLHLKGIGQGKESLAAMFTGQDEDETHPIPPEMIFEVGNLQSDCYNNLAACLLQQGDPNYGKVIEYCDSVLSIQAGNVKAVYRKGQALYHLKRYEKALDVLSQANEEPSVKKYTTLCKRELQKQEKELKAAYRGMFSKYSNDSKATASKDNEADADNS
ncbi:tetratricopeptide repeat protein 9C-like [Haliotis rufescens]|uniref:tetratricopeptide repeat protein 9C-like n=1 Tax=Haliotis rufescens TaxID=6454 RepID=UPI00201FA882|nr:tetratricopeptide repeat protein 9C-like [Haliotis rufescens]